MDESNLDAAIKRVCRKTSYYWLMRHVRGKEREQNREVEVRVDLPVAAMGKIKDVPGWKIAHADANRGMLFLRRSQTLTDVAVRAMFVDALTFAHSHLGKFHSWAHEPDLVEW